MIKLFGWPGSGAYYRACVALDLKDIPYEPVMMDPDRKEHHGSAYLDVNPQGLVPAFVEGDLVLIQTMAIIEYLEEIHPHPRLLPETAVGRARVRGLAEICNCEIHPIINRRIRMYLAEELGHTPDEVTRWLGHWYGSAFSTLESLVDADESTGRFCHGDTPTVADIYLVSTLDAAQRYGADVTPYRKLLEIEAACLELPAFRDKLPRTVLATR